jgi:small GTP-binding protein
MGNYVSWILTQLGFNNLQKEATLVVVGLDNAGKTTLLTRLVTGKLNSSLPPTKRATDETFHLSGITFNAWDLGGHEAVRHLWSEYSPKAHGIIYMIDATDKRRFVEAGEELELLVMDIVEANQNGSEDAPTIPIAVFLNKYDRENAVPMKEVTKAISLMELMEDIGHSKQYHPSAVPPIEVFCGSVVENRGYQKAFQWLSEFVV